MTEPSTTCVNTNVDALVDRCRVIVWYCVTYLDTSWPQMATLRIRNHNMTWME